MSDAASSVVLIAVEEPMVSRILEHKLRREGHEVRTVHGPAQLHSALSAGDIDVLLLSAALFRDAPRPAPRAGWLLLAGAFDSDDTVHAAMRNGAAGVVRLPFKPTAVAAQVATLLTLVPS